MATSAQMSAQHLLRAGGLKDLAYRVFFQTLMELEKLPKICKRNK
jgi:hypothetical protein